ncbi:MAG: hypothetical protein JJE09_14840 [Bacteroidia bacterium]|nr:hypothetical protein [Bacteroidia bacterium]
MKKKFLAILVLVLTISQLPQAQTKAADSVIIRVGEGSKVIFAIQDKKDLETLKHYDFQALMEDMITKLENKDTTSSKKPSIEYLKDSVAIEKQVVATEPEKLIEENWNEDTHKHERYKGRRTYHSVNIDLGTNNYLSNGQFPDQTNELYTVKPWGSWYVGINSIQRTRVARKFFIEWGGGVSWYNFKFQNTRTSISKDDTGLIFSEDTRDINFLKSKLTATYLNASLVPILDFGGNRRRTSLFEGHGSDSFRIGVGPYVGYRIDSYSKQVYKEDGEKRKNRERDNLYLNNIRYGLRAQIGFNDIDFFINYDTNELFSTGKGPQLNAFSFGITL